MAKEFIPTSTDDITAVWLTSALNESGILSGGEVTNLKSNQSASKVTWAF